MPILVAACGPFFFFRFYAHRENGKKMEGVKTENRKERRRRIRS